MPGGVHPPFSVIEQWAEISNPEHPTQTKGSTVVILAILMYAMDICIVLARLWARARLQRNLGLDDVLIVAAMVSSFVTFPSYTAYRAQLPITGLVVSIYLGKCATTGQLQGRCRLNVPPGYRHYGFDRHAWDLTPQMAVSSRKITIAMEINYVAATSLIKISILTFYRRLARGSVSPVFRCILRGAIASIVLYVAAAGASLGLSCQPFSAYWNSVDIIWLQTHKAGVDFMCDNEGVNDIVLSLFSIAQDFMACGLPLMLFWGLHMPSRQKVALSAIFGLGFL